MTYITNFVLCLLFVLPGVSLGQLTYNDLPTESIFENLLPDHPRLLLTQERLETLKTRSEEDSTLQRYVDDVIAAADIDYGKPLLEYKKVGPRLLSVSREALNRLYVLSFAYRWTHQREYAEKAIQNLYAVCSFQDWNPSHFLDTAEMSHAVAVGYDWLYYAMSEDDRAFIREALIRLGLKPGFEAYFGEDPAWWIKSRFNWNQVCNSGLIIGALAVADTDPEIAGRIVNAGIQSLPVALQTYGPDGVWLEGPGYWHYATRYTGYGISALETALGSDFNLTGIEGMRETGAFPIYTTGPTGLFLNFADSGEWRKRNPMPVLFWLADEFRNSFYANSEHRLLQQRQSEPEHVVWYTPPAFGESTQPDLDRVFEGDVDVAVFRSAWDDPEALFVGVKSGYNQVNHGHLDLGNFELDALGVRWARDLGSDNYNLPNYWGKDEGAQRWEYYRLNSRSHNVPLINNDNQHVFATSDFLRFETRVDEPFVIVDLTEAYEDYSQATHRGVKMVAQRQAILVQDEFDLSQRAEVRWGMTTDAEISIESRHTAVLTIGDNQLQATILTPRRAQFKVESAEQAPPEKTNIGIQRLIVDAGKKRRHLQISVLLAPVWSNGKTVTDLKVEPLETW